MLPKICEDLQSLSEVKTTSHYQCDICVAAGDTWMHLRLCQTCGEVHCCDSSPNKHATRHFHETGHPVISSAEPNDRWVWCYEHSAMAKY